MNLENTQITLKLPKFVNLIKIEVTTYKVALIQCYKNGKQNFYQHRKERRIQL